MENMQRWRDPVTVATVIIALAAVLNLAATAYIGSATREYVQATNAYVRVSQDTFQSSARPYIGINWVGLNEPCDSDVTSDEVTRMRKSRNLPFTVGIENYGTIPARDVSINFTVMINGAIQPIVMAPDALTAVFPRQRLTRSSLTASTLVTAVLDGAATAEIEVKVTYKGLSDEEFYSIERAKFNSVTLNFFNTGGKYK